MKILIIYNPLAGKKGNKEKIIKNFLKQSKVTANWCDITKNSLNDFKPNEFDKIFVAGGDGTVKETASWIITHKSQTPLAIIPIGSANILAISLGIPFEIKKAIELGLTNKICKIDVGQINNRFHFLIAAGIGFDAKVIKNTSLKLKKAWGWLAYILSLVVNFFNAKANKFFIKIDNKTFTVNAQGIFVSNFAKFFNIVLNPKSKINDGFLNVSILNTLNIKDVGILLHRAMTGGSKKDWRYQYYTAKEVYILPFNKKTPIQVDGEIVDLPYLNIKILPVALKIISNKLP